MPLFFCCGPRRRCSPATDSSEDSLNTTQKLSKLAGTAPCITQSHACIKLQPQSRDNLVMSPAFSGEEPLELGELLVEDSEGEEERHDALTKSSGALNVVRTKLIRHISQENQVGRQSRASAGHSQEEAARRAELRRFRHQRIQEELKSEENNDESSNTSHRSTRYLSPLIDVGQPGGGPRDTIEFAVGDGHTLLHISPSQLPTSTSPDEGGAERHNNIRDESNISDNPAIGPTQACEIRTVSPEMRQSTDLPPRRRPSTQSSVTQKLAGCSYNSSRLDRILGIDNEFDIRHGAHTAEEQSALGIWLIAQDQRSRASSIRQGDIELNADIKKKQHSFCMADLGGIDRVADIPLLTNQNGLTVPQNSLGSLNGATESKQSPERDSFESASFSTNTPGDAPKRITSLQNDPLLSSSMTDCERPSISDIPITRQADNSSSNYPSVLPSFQPSPNRSQSNVHYLNADDLESLQLSPFSWQGTFSVQRGAYGSEEKSSYATAEDDISYSDLNGSSIQIIRPSDQETSNLRSPPYSETASLRQRESELLTIERRFGEVLLRKKPLPSFGSRFKEEFHNGPSESRRLSLMARINNFSVSRRSKTGSSNHEVVQHRSSSTGGLLFDYITQPVNCGFSKITDSMSDSKLENQQSISPPATHSSLRTSIHLPSLLPARCVLSGKPSLMLRQYELSPDLDKGPSNGSIRHGAGSTQSIVSSDPKPPSNNRTHSPLRLDKIPPLSRRNYNTRGKDNIDPSHNKSATLQEHIQNQPSLRHFHRQAMLKSQNADLLLGELRSQSLPRRLGNVVRTGLKKLLSTSNSQGSGNDSLEGLRQNGPHIDVNPESCEAGLKLCSGTSELMVGTEHARRVITRHENSTPEPALLSAMKAREGACSPEENITAHEIRQEDKTMAPQKQPRGQTADDSSIKDLFLTAVNHSGFESQGTLDKKNKWSSEINNIQPSLRRWRSAANLTLSNRDLGSWTTQNMAQSLSLTDLRA